MELMYRQTFTPNDNSINIAVPAEWKGMNVEVIVFPVNTKEVVEIKPFNTDKRKKRNELLDKYLFDLSDFKFNRDEANDYE